MQSWHVHTFVENLQSPVPSIRQPARCLDAGWIERVYRTLSDLLMENARANKSSMPLKTARLVRTATTVPRPAVDFILYFLRERRGSQSWTHGLGLHFNRGCRGSTYIVH
jgi:hypothetical protein